ncbi:MAG: hypothetical protein WAL25_04595 [Acidimicrobiia bacterium]
MRCMVVALVVVLAACSPSGSTDETTSSTAPPVTNPTASTSSAEGDQATTTVAATPSTFPPAPQTPEGPLDPDVRAGVDRLLEGLYTEDWDLNAIGDLAHLGDARTAWLLADLMRFYQSGLAYEELVAAFSELTGADRPGDEEGSVWAMSHLVVWDLPAYPEYDDDRTAIYGPAEGVSGALVHWDAAPDRQFVTWGGAGAPPTS